MSLQSGLSPALCVTPENFFSSDFHKNHLFGFKLTQTRYLKKFFFKISTGGLLWISAKNLLPEKN